MEKGVSGEVFNVGSGEEVSVNELCDLVSEATDNLEIEPIYKESRTGDIRRSWSDIGKASREIGYRPETSLKEGLEKFVEERNRF